VSLLLAVEAVRRDDAPEMAIPAIAITDSGASRSRIPGIAIAHRSGATRSSFRSVASLGEARGIVARDRGERERLQQGLVEPVGGALGRRPRSSGRARLGEAFHGSGRIHSPPPA
jgi:hypothetical protein